MMVSLYSPIVKSPLMYASLWIGIMLSTQSGCSMFKKDGSTTEIAAEVRKPLPTQAGQPVDPRPNPMAARMNQPSTMPKVPPAGARLSYSSIQTDKPVLAITFDDGPHPVNTPKLLEILSQRNIKATFFLVGQNVKQYPDLVRRILAEGHEIGNHTWTHASLSSISDDAVRKELKRSDDALFEIAGYRPHLMRPPYGAINTRLKNLIYSEFGYPCILWSVDPQDWRRPGVSVVVNRLVSGARPGAILLTHDIHAPTIVAVPQALDQLLAKGYQFVTVSQLMNIEKANMPLGVLIRPASVVGGAGS